MSGTDDTRLDQLAQSVHTLVTETASRQVSREIAHLAEIEADHHGVHAVAPPVGYRAPASGVVMTHVVARSREVPSATVELRVAVWVSDDDAAGPGLLITRSDDDRTLRIAAADVDPQPSTHVEGQVNDFVAVIIAGMVSGLNVAMQRTHVHGSDGDVAEYEPG